MIRACAMNWGGIVTDREETAHLSGAYALTHQAMKKQARRACVPADIRRDAGGGFNIVG
jgi:hypothetical protein